MATFDLAALADPALVRWHAQVRRNAPERWETVGRFADETSAATRAYRAGSADPATDGARVLDSATGRWNYVI